MWAYGKEEGHQIRMSCVIREYVLYVGKGSGLIWDSEIKFGALMDYVASLPAPTQVRHFLATGKSHSGLGGPRVETTTEGYRSLCPYNPFENAKATPTFPSKGYYERSIILPFRIDSGSIRACKCSLLYMIVL